MQQARPGIRRRPIALVAGEPFPAARRSRIRDFLLYGVGRPLLLVFWSLVLWGTVILAALAWKAATAGPRAVLVAAQAQVTQAGGWVNLALASLALLVWTLVAGGIVGRRDRAP